MPYQSNKKNLIIAFVTIFAIGVASLLIFALNIPSYANLAVALIAIIGGGLTINRPKK